MARRTKPCWLRWIELMSDERRSELHSDDTKGAKQENGRTKVPIYKSKGELSQIVLLWG